MFYYWTDIKSSSSASQCTVETIHFDTPTSLVSELCPVSGVHAWKTPSDLISQHEHLSGRATLSNLHLCVCFLLFITVLYHLLSFLPLFFPVCLQFKVDGEWWTWIDYERFQELILEYEESEGTKSFSAMDYMAKTPSWAIFGARERGFEPSDTRFQRKNKTKDISGCWCYFCLPTLSLLGNLYF